MIYHLIYTLMVSTAVIGTEVEKLMSLRYELLSELNQLPSVSAEEAWMHTQRLGSMEQYVSQRPLALVIPGQDPSMSLDDVYHSIINNHYERNPMAFIHNVDEIVRRAGTSKTVLAFGRIQSESITALNIHAQRQAINEALIANGGATSEAVDRRDATRKLKDRIMDIRKEMKNLRMQLAALDATFLAIEEIAKTFEADLSLIDSGTEATCPTATFSFDAVLTDIYKTAGNPQRRAIPIRKILLKYFLDHEEEIANGDVVGAIRRDSRNISLSLRSDILDKLSNADIHLGDLEERSQMI